MHNHKDRLFGKNIVNVKGDQNVNANVSHDKENVVNEAFEKKEVRVSPQSIPPYQQEIYEFLSSREKLNEFSINEYYINENIRQTTVLLNNMQIKYIKRLCQTFDQRPQTFFQSIHLLDQMIQLTNPKTDDLELLSLTCLFIASKYEEIYPPPLYMILKNSGVKIGEVIQKEKEILQLLNFNVISETTVVWMKLFLEMLNTRLKRPEIMDRCMKTAELTLMYTSFLNCKKSDIALCILVVVEMIFGTHKTQFQWDRLNLHTKPSADSKPVKILTYLLRYYK